ncbi:MAG TPA: HEPN domain-containing protein [Rhodothermales bacterium]|nr:HEPN domain-containing protein [Rhodothermales bacterium]
MDDQQINALTRKSQKYLQSAAVLLELEDYDSCASRAYFAMFYAAQALMVRERHTLPGNQSLRTAFMESYVANGRLPDRAGTALKQAADLQEMADYGLNFAVTQDAAEYVLQEAEAFVNSLARLTLKPA